MSICLTLDRTILIFALVISLNVSFVIFLAKYTDSLKDSTVQWNWEQIFLWRILPIFITIVDLVFLCTVNYLANLYIPLFVAITLTAPAFIRLWIRSFERQRYYVFFLSSNYSWLDGSMISMVTFFVIDYGLFVFAKGLTL